MKFERPQKGNPHRLVVAQHRIPVRTIARFANLDGTVEVEIGQECRRERLRPSAGIFRIRRAWNQRAEQGYMKHIEDKFQPIADRIVAGQTNDIPEVEIRAINEFFLLWWHRSRVQPPDDLEIQVSGVTGEALTKDEQEALEAKHYMFAREGGKFATRDMVGIQVQAKIMRDGRTDSIHSWGVIRAPEGEFIMPDVPAHDLMPISPTVLLAANYPSGLISKSNLNELNIGFLAYSRRYFFGRDLTVALADATSERIKRALIDRDQNLAAGVFE